MKEAILIIEKKCTIERIQELTKKEFRFEEVANGLIVYEEKAIIISFDFDLDILDSYSIEEYIYINKNLTNVITYFVKFSEFQTFKQCIGILSKKYMLLIDNDRGGLANITILNQFVTCDEFYKYTNK